MAPRKTIPDGITIFNESLRALLMLPDEDAGRVIKSAAEYQLNGTVPEDMDLADRIVYTVIQSGIDKGRQKFEDRCKRNQRNRTGTSGQSSPVVTAGDESCPELNGTDLIETDLNETEKPSPSPRKKHGEFGRVLLTDEEYQGLLNNMGQLELDRCIQYVDESAQSTDNKNKWKDWNLVIRKCHRDGWGKKPGTQTSDDWPGKANIPRAY